MKCSLFDASQMKFAVSSVQGGDAVLTLVLKAKKMICTTFSIVKVSLCV